MASPPPQKLYAAFIGCDLVARGALEDVAAPCKARLDDGEQQRVAIFDDDTGRVVDVDFVGTAPEVLSRCATRDQGPNPPPDPAVKRGRGRPKLGVVCREVSLLPRHWEWLAEQRGGASASLRRLVDAARKSEAPEARSRRALDAAHRFIWDIAGDQPNFEEATRSLYAMDFERVEVLTEGWSAGIREQLGRYLDRAR